MHRIRDRVAQRLSGIGLSGAIALLAAWAASPAAAPVTAQAGNGVTPSEIHAVPVGIGGDSTAPSKPVDTTFDHAIQPKEGTTLATGGGQRSGSEGGGGSKAGVWNGSNWPGINYAAVSTGRFRGPTPPDVNGQVGPNHYMEAVNGKFAVYNRSGIQLAAASDDYFTGRNRQTPERSMSDPTVNYDPRTNRWFYQEASFNTGADCTGGRPDCNFEIDFGWSSTGDPSNLDAVVPQANGWCHYSASTGANFLYDYTKTAVDDHWMYFAANVFDFTSNPNGAFASASIIIFPKPTLPITSCPALTGYVYGGPLGGGAQLQHPGTTEPIVTITPVSTFATSAGSNVYLATAKYACFTGGRHEILILHMGTTGPPPVLHYDGEQSVSNYSCPPNVPEPNGKSLDTLDGRIAQGASIADPDHPGMQGIWVAHTVALGTGADNIGIQWYEILMPTSGGDVDNAPGLAQQGSLGGATSAPFTFAWNSGIAPAKVGNEAVLGYNWAEAPDTTGAGTSLTQLRAASHDPSLGAGVMGNPVTLAASLDAPEDFACQPPRGNTCRWGDYAGASTDPNDNHVVWGSGMWTGTRHLDPGGTGTNQAQWATNNFAISSVVSGATQSGPFNAITPNRVADTRTGTPIGPGGTLDIQITGTTGVPSSGVGAVAVNVTGANATVPTYFTVYPTGSPTPMASTLNLVPGRQVANLTEIPVGAGGKVTIFNKNGTADAIVDVFGYTNSTLQTNTAGLFKPLVPTRILDTRTGGGTPFAAGETRTLQVAGTLPDGRANAVVLNVTAVNGGAPGFLTVWPADQPMPTASNVNFATGQNVANRAMVGLGTGALPNGGAVKIFNGSGTGAVDLVVDENGWFTDGTNPGATGGTFHPLTPSRVLDSRPGGTGQYNTPWPGNVSRILYVAGLGGIPVSGAMAVVATATITNPTAGSYLTAYPADSSQVPLASDQNWGAGETRASMVVVRLAGDYSLYLYNNNGSVDILLDVTGYYG